MQNASFFYFHSNAELDICNMNRAAISNFLRRMRLLHAADYLRYYYQKIKNSSSNNRFKKNNTGVALPPDYLLYESFMLHYPDYFYGGRQTAIWLKDILSKYTSLQNQRILDWGCGPGRIVRHLPELINNGCEFYGTDYNYHSIEWCRKHLNSIHFSVNSINGNLSFPNNHFDVIYGISIFTHLSLELHYHWYKELYRTLKPGGILFLTAHGNSFTTKLTSTELKRFNNGELIVRGDVKEGHRVFTAFHPKEFMCKLFDNAIILEHVVTPPKNRELHQDVWIVRK